ncbi:hypothetical protein FKM82_009959 [Ascaphus truei]
MQYAMILRMGRWGYNDLPPKNKAHFKEKSSPYLEGHGLFQTQPHPQRVSEQGTEGSFFHWCPAWTESSANQPGSRVPQREMKGEEKAASSEKPSASSGVRAGNRRAAPSVNRAAEMYIKYFLSLHCVTYVRTLSTLSVLKGHQKSEVFRISLLQHRWLNQRLRL